MAAAKLAERLVVNLPLFRTVAREHLAALLEDVTLHRLKRGVAILRRGEQPENLFGVAQGQLKLTLRGDNGEEKLLRIVAPGETFGEALVFSPRPSPVDAVALTDALVVAFPAKRIHKLAESDPGFARAALASLSERMHQLVEEIEAGTLLTARQRIASYLVALAKGASRARLPVTKTLVASQLGVTKETFSRLLREFADRGLILVEKRDIVLHDRARLEAIAHPHADAHAVSDKRVSESSSA
jgi:CRP/FNR family transcriptional regulator, dissimilatory nitrate respiration regulator